MHQVSTPAEEKIVSQFESIEQLTCLVNLYDPMNESNSKFISNLGRGFLKIQVVLTLELKCFNSNVQEN